MKKVISFSLWGSNPDYNIGAIKNAILAKIYYPDFECWFYIHKDTVPTEIIDNLSKLDNTVIIIKDGDITKCKPMMWRFEAIDDPDVEIMMSRDTDTRILLREKLAVDEWLNSNKLFHIMRDHPHHNFKILGGMFGTKKIPQIKSWNSIMSNIIQISKKSYDQDFLSNYIYDNIKNNSIIHANFNTYEDYAIKFPIEYDNEYRFVGEYVYSNDSRSVSHIEDLKRSINEKNNLKINLITSFYIIKNNDTMSIQRNNELLECLYKNINNDNICKIHLYVDDIHALNKAIKLNKNNKLNIINIGKQPLYSEMFEYCIDNLKDEIVMICNSDVYLYKCDLNVLSKLDSNVYALSRHERNLKCKVYGAPSYDAFIFYPKYLNKSILKNTQHVQNIIGADNSIINNFIELNLNLYNPCFEIMIIHLHDSELRTYNNQRIAHDNFLIKQEYLDNVYKDEYKNEYTYFHGLDHNGDDLLYNNSYSLNGLKFYCNKNDDIVAFNTLGFMKSNIDINNLKETSWINRTSTHGIYIKNKYLQR